MLVTITEYNELARDGNGNAMPLGENALVLQSITGDGDSDPLKSGTRVIRIATDTAVTIDGELYMPGVDYKAVNGGETLAIAAVA